MNIHEYQAKELLAKLRRAGARGPCRDERRGGRRGRQEAARTALGGQGADPRRRARQGQVQGAWRADAKGGVRLAHSIDEVRAHAAEMLGKHAGHDPDRTGGQAGPAPLHHRRRRHREGILSRAAGRPRDRPHRRGRLDRRRDGHREGRARHAREDHDDHDRSGDRPDAASRPRGRRGAGPHRRSRQAGAEGSRQPLRRIPRHRRVADRDQSARRRPTRAQLLVLDAKVGFDNNAEFRHPDLEQLRDLSEEDPMEIEASKYDLAYIKLDGNIGCMVNGAGLAMATMDIIKLEGGVPGQFPRRRRRRVEGKGHRGVQDHPQRSGGEGHPRQHLRRDHALRHHRRRHRRRGARSRPAGAAGRPARRHQRPAGQGHPGVERPCRSFRPTTSATPRRRSSPK